MLLTSVYSYWLLEIKDGLFPMGRRVLRTGAHIQWEVNAIKSYIKVPHYGLHTTVMYIQCMIHTITGYIHGTYMYMHDTYMVHMIHTWHLVSLVMVRENGASKSSSS